MPLCNLGGSFIQLNAAKFELFPLVSEGDGIGVQLLLGRTHGGDGLGRQFAYLPVVRSNAVWVVFLR